MKITIGFTLLFISMNTIAQNAKEIEFAKHVVEVFVSKDFHRYNQLIMDSSDYEEIYKNMLAKEEGRINGGNQDLILNLNKTHDQGIREIKKTVDSNNRTTFKRLMLKGEKIGIDWSKVKFVNFIYRKDKPENLDNYGIRGHINIKCKDSLFIIFGIEAIEVTKGYKVTDIRTVLPGGIAEYIDPDLLDDDDL